MADKLTHKKFNDRVLAAMQPPAPTKRALPQLSQLLEKGQQIRGNGSKQAGA